MRWVLRILLLLLLLIALASGAAYLHLTSPKGRRWLDRTVRDRIERTVDQAVVDGYHFRMDSLATDPGSGDVHISGIELRFDTALVDQLRAGTHDYLFAARTDNIALEGLSIWRLLLFQEVSVHAIRVERPSLRYVVRNKRVRLDAPLQRLPDVGGPAVDLFLFDHIAVSGADALMQDIDGHLPALRATGLHVQAGPVRITAPAHGRAHLAMGPVDLRFDSLTTVLNDGYHLRIGPTRLSDSHHTGIIQGIRIAPRAPQLPKAGTMLDIGIDSITLQAPAIADLIADQAIRVHDLTIHGLTLDAALDKTLPAPTPHPTALPGAALLLLPYELAIDSMHIRRGTLHYRERSDATGKWAHIPFSRLSADLSGIANTMDHLRDQPELTGSVQAMFMDTARMTLTYRTGLGPDAPFVLDAGVGQLPLTALSDVTSALLRLDLLDGELHHFRMHMEGNDRRAHGTADIDYSGLRSAVASDATSTQRHRLFGALMDHVMAADSAAGLTDQRRRSFSIDRDPQRSVLTYIWHFTREGLQRNLRPGVRDRITTLIRQDREERRKRRAAKP